MPGKIMYVCESCADGAPEQCGHYDRDELRIAPDGRWLCDICYDEETPSDAPVWMEAPVPPEYAPAS